MTQTTSTTSTRTPTRASCTTCEHALRARSLRHTLMMCHMHLMVQGVLESHPIRIVIRVCSLWFHLTPFLLRPDLHRPFPLLLPHAPDNLRTSANKGSNDAYDVHTSLTQMTAAKVMDIISRLPGCGGQAADAVSAYTQVKMEDAHKLLKIPKSKCPDSWIRLQRHKWPKSWSSVEDPVVPLERNLYGHPLAGLLWERQFEKILLKHGWEKIPNWECLFVHREKGLFLSVYVDDIK